MTSTRPRESRLKLTGSGGNHSRTFQPVLGEHEDQADGVRHRVGTIIAVGTGNGMASRREEDAVGPSAPIPHCLEPAAPRRPLPDGFGHAVGTGIFLGGAHKRFLPG